MSDWPDRYAEMLSARLSVDSPRAGLEDDHDDLILDLARIVAHGTDRKNAPLATFLAGRYTALSEVGGADPATALTEALDVASGLLGGSTEER